MESCLSQYRIAGEIFGRLITELGFGDLAMLNDPSGVAGVMYQWSFNAKGKRYGSQYVISFDELTIAEACREEYVSRYAKHVAQGFKLEFRTLTNTDTASVATNGLNLGDE
jgi:hypothetical protein